MRAREAVLFLLAAAVLTAHTSQATPFVPDFSNGPVVFDFEDGLQGWTLENAVQRVNTQILGGQWAILGDGLVIGPWVPGTMHTARSLMSMTINLTEVATFGFDQFSLGERRAVGLVRIERFPSGGRAISAFGFEVGPTGENPETRVYDLAFSFDTSERLGFPLERVLEIGIWWEGIDGTEPEDQLAFIDNITLTPIPEPSTLLLCTVGLGALALVGRRRKTRGLLLALGLALAAASKPAQAVPRRAPRR
jgi:hypothetical protein